MESEKEANHSEIEEQCFYFQGRKTKENIREARKQLEKENYNYQNHLLVSGQDIEEVPALMCYIQLSLLGIAGYFKVGNSLIKPMTMADDLKNYWFTPIYFSDVWTMRRLFHSI